VLCILLPLTKGSYLLVQQRCHIMMSAAMMMNICRFTMEIYLDLTANMSMDAEEPVTMKSLYRQLLVMTARMDAFADDLHALKADVHAIKESNRSSSSSNRRIPCPLGCGADFKKVR
jgi:hypothetical protein